MFGYDEETHLATPGEACREWAWNVGEDFPDSQWLLSDYDTWERNPHYHGVAQPHPHELEALADYEWEMEQARKEGSNFKAAEVLDADLPF